MEYTLTQRKIINLLLVAIIFVGVLLCSLFLYRTYQENEKKPSSNQIANNDYYSVTVEDIKKAVANYTNYPYTPYDLLIYNNEINREEFNTYSSINFLLGFLNNATVSNLIKANLTVFNHNISSSDILNNGSYKVDNNIVSMANDVESPLSLLTGVTDVKENDDKLIITAYVLFQRLNDEEKNLHSYYRINYYHDIEGNFFNDAALIYEELKPNDSFNPEEYVDSLNLLEWTFEKNDEGLYQFTKLKLIR